MTLIRWRNDPFFSQLTNLQEELGRRYTENLGPDAELRGFAPPMDVSEDAEGYRVTTELPGLDNNDVQINLVGRTLTIKGEKKQELESQDKNFHRIERSYGSFVRSVELPASIDAERVKADFSKGLLTVTVGKTEDVKPRQIPIHTSDK